MPKLNHKSLRCPCGTLIDLDGLRDSPSCPNCHAHLYVARAYPQWASLLTFVLIVLIAAITHSATSGGTWLLAIILLAIPIRIAVSMFMPLVLKGGSPPLKLTLLPAVLGCALTVFFVEFLIFGWAHVILGASQRELAEHLEMLSMPLGWINPAFIIRPNKSFADVCGIILGNSFFYAIPMMACVRVVQWAFKRGRVTQIGITGHADADDED